MVIAMIQVVLHIDTDACENDRIFGLLEHSFI